MTQDMLKNLEFNLIYKMFLNKQLNLVDNINYYSFCYNVDCKECRCRSECDNLRMQIKELYSRGHVSKTQVEELMDTYPRGRVLKLTLKNS